VSLAGDRATSGEPQLQLRNMGKTLWAPDEEMPRTAAARERGGRSRGGKEEGGREMKQETVLNESNEMRLLRLDALGFEMGKDRMIFVVSSSGFYIHPGSYRWS
jgi:hypothetical protein